jgi:hypothetical protein
MFHTVQRVLVVQTDFSEKISQESFCKAFHLIDRLNQILSNDPINQKLEQYGKMENSETSKHFQVCCVDKLGLCCDQHCNRFILGCFQILMCFIDFKKTTYIFPNLHDHRTPIWELAIISLTTSLFQSTTMVRVEKVAGSVG